MKLYFLAKPWVLVLLLASWLLIVVFFSFQKFLINKDFSLFIKLPCNSSVSNCFVHSCEDWDSRCSESDDGKFVYKILIKKQKNIKECFGENCKQLTCENGEVDCKEFYCSSENLELFELDDVCSAAI